MPCYVRAQSVRLRRRWLSDALRCAPVQEKLDTTADEKRRAVDEMHEAGMSMADLYLLAAAPLCARRSSAHVTQHTVQPQCAIRRWPRLQVQLSASAANRTAGEARVGKGARPCTRKSTCSAQRLLACTVERAEPYASSTLKRMRARAHDCACAAHASARRCGILRLCASTACTAAGGTGASDQRAHVL